MIFVPGIKQAIQKGNFFIACFSNEYIRRTKTYMNEELILAVDELRQYSVSKSWFIPVRLSECEIPDINIGFGQSLRDLQWVDLFKDWKGGIERISCVINPLADNIKALLYALKSTDQEIRKRSIEALVKNNVKVAEKILINIASSNSDPLRGMAITALGSIGGPRSASFLVTLVSQDALKSTDQEIRKRSIEALVKNNAKVAEKVLIDIASSNSDPLRGMAVTAMGKIGGPRSASFLASVVSQDDHISRAAVPALKRLEDIASLRIDLKNKDRSIRYNAARKLLLMGIIDNSIVANLHLSCHNTQLEFPGNIPSDKTVFQKITSLGETAVPSLINLRKTGNREQKFAYNILLRAIGPDTVPDKIWHEVKDMPDLDYTDYSLFI